MSELVTRTYGPHFVDEDGWHAYRLSPVDFWWEQLELVSSVIERLKAIPKEEAEADCAFEAGPDLASFEGNFLRAIRLGQHVGWEGDYRSYAEPRVMWLPDPESFYFAFAFIWKQDNNGSTFVVSPFALPWLEESLV